MLVLVVLRTIQYNMTKMRVSTYSYQQCYTRWTVAIGCTEDNTVQYDNIHLIQKRLTAAIVNTITVMNYRML